MHMLVLSAGLENYQQMSQLWKETDVIEVVKIVNKLLTLKEHSYPACGTQEVFIIPDSEKETMVTLKNLLQKWLYESGTEHYLVSRQIGIW